MIFEDELENNCDSNVQMAKQLLNMFSDMSTILVDYIAVKKENEELKAEIERDREFQREISDSIQKTSGNWIKFLLDDRVKIEVKGNNTSK